MAFRATKFILIFSIIILFSSTFIKAADITSILNNHQEFAIFNDLLSQTGVAAAINSRHTITVLVVDNSAMGPLISKPQAQAINILSTHVILDYYDDEKLASLNDKSTLLTTLFQTTGMALDQQGFLNLTVSGNGHDVVFGSAVQGAPRVSRVIQNVVADPYDISVIQVSEPIIVPGINQVSSPNSSPSPSPSPSSSPSPSPYEDSPVPAPAWEGPTSSPTPTPTPAPAPALTPEEGPAPAPQDEDGSPAWGPYPYEGPAPGPNWDWDWDEVDGPVPVPAPEYEEDEAPAPTPEGEDEGPAPAPGPEGEESEGPGPNAEGPENDDDDDWDMFGPVPAPGPDGSQKDADDDENGAPSPMTNGGAARVSVGGGAVVAALMGLVALLL